MTSVPRASLEVDRLTALIYEPLDDIPDDMLDALILSFEVEQYLRREGIDDPELRVLLTSLYMRKASTIASIESTIQPGLPLYLITWAPNPAELPDGPFELQHDYNVEVLQKFLLSCQTGAFCVESTQRGNPHYHGWYQVSWNPIKERARIAIIKVLESQGLVKITESVGQYKIDSYNRHANCLYYYKKELLNKYLDIVNNPILSTTKPPPMPAHMAMFFKKPGERVTAQQLCDRVTKRQMLAEFYNDKSYGL